MRSPDLMMSISFAVLLTAAAPGSAQDLGICGTVCQFDLGQFTRPQPA
jgi:hypothetical protein